MKTTTLLGFTLAVALLSARVMATDFHALAVLQGTTPIPLQDAELEGTEGGFTCQTPVTPDGGRFTFCIWSPGAHFVFGNELSFPIEQFPVIVN